MPFFQAHGEVDNILPLKYGINTSKKLKQFLLKHEVSGNLTYLKYSQTYIYDKLHSFNNENYIIF